MPNPEAGETRIDVQRVGLRSGYPIWIVDSQHRKEAGRRLWQELLDGIALGDIDMQHVLANLKRSSISVIFVLTEDRDQITRIFVRMGKTRPLPPALIVAMDTSVPSHRLSLKVAKYSTMLSGGKPAGRLEYQNSSPAKDKLYTAANVRAAAANMLIGFKDRHPDEREVNLAHALPKFGTGPDEERLDRAARWIADVWDYAFKVMPGWRDIAKKQGGPNESSPAEFRENYLLGSAAGLYTFAGVLAASREADIEYKRVIMALADLPWRRQDFVKEPQESHHRHRFFEGTLAKTVSEVDEHGSLRTIVRTGGGTRTSYEAATKAVLAHLAKSPEFKGLERPETWKIIGLLPSGRRGRPRKAA